MDLSIIVNKKIDDYLKKSCKFYDVNYQKWINCNYGILDEDIEDIFKDLIYDISEIIANEIYKDSYILHYENKNQIYIFNNDRTIANLVSWKYENEYNNTILMRYGFNGRVRYIEININTKKYLLNN